MRRRIGFVAAIVLAVVHLYAFPYFGGLKHANELPRVLTTQELVHHGTFTLDARLGELGSTMDIAVTPDGHRYQNKAPGMSILAAPLYALLVLAFRTVNAGLPSLLVTTWLLRVVFATLPALFFIPVFRRVASRFANGDPLARDASLIAYALGSMAFPYALCFMSHVPSAVAVGGAFAIAIRFTRGRSRVPRHDAFAIGTLLGLAMMIEYQAVFAAAFIGLFVLLRGKHRLKTLGILAFAAAPWIGILLAYHWGAFGSPFRTGYAFSADEANRVGFMGIVGPSAKSVKQLFTYGSNGLLVLSPWIFLSLVGVYWVVRDRDLRAAVGPEALLSAAIVLTYFAFVVSLEPEFGRAGWSVGPRYLTIAMPFLAWLAATGLAQCTAYSALLVPALAAVMVGTIVNVLAASTYPHWPTQFGNPIFEVSIRLLREGHAPHSLGTALGLRGIPSIVPLYVIVLVFIGAVLIRAGARARDFAIAAVVAALAISRLSLRPPSAEPHRTTTWTFVVSTYEP